MTEYGWPIDAKVTAAVLVAVVLVELMIVGGITGDRTRSASRVDSTVPPSTILAPHPSSAPPSKAAPSGPTDDPSVDELAVAPAASGAGYDRDLFGGSFIDADDNGCDSRCEVLARQRRLDLAGLPQGGWLSPYDGYSTPDPSELDIDHVVPLKEAWVSGAATWDGPTRLAFANDLDSPELLAVTAATNRSKGDRDPASWQPPARGYWCTYAHSWIDVKAKWRLTADAAEVAALRNMLSGC